MERYEVKVKYEQIKKLMDQGMYQEAMDIANTIDWDKSRNIHMLCLAGEVFERCGFFEDSKAIYLRAYQLQPQSRIVIYRLAELSIKLSDYEDSVHFYKKYEEAAPYDVNLLVLRYKIYKAKGASTETLISILEELKENDYHERWAYELAKLYSDAGMVEKCVAECDEINLWFGKGHYVRKALLLKKRYQMLTGEQQKKLEETSAMPQGFEEAITHKDQAEEKQKQTQEAFVQASFQQGAEVEQARKAAIEAAREARAAQLLEEAAIEDAEEEAAMEEDDSKEFIGQGIYPNLDIPIPKWTKEPALGEPVYEQSAVGWEATEEFSAYDAKTVEKTMAEQVLAEELDEEALASVTEREEKSAQEDGESGLSESDILARNIALALEGKLPRQKKPYDEYIGDTDIEDDNTPEDEEIFEKKESAFHKMWRMTSSAVSKKPKAATVFAKEQDYDIQIKPVTVSRYDTINLQKELAKSIRSIMNATEKEEVEKTMEDINRSMEESNIPKLIQTKRLHIQEVQEALEKASVETKGTWTEEAKTIDSKIQKLLGEEYDGQMRMLVEEQKKAEKQITGQMRLDDLLQEEDQLQLNEAKKRALEQAEEYIDQLSAVVPYMEEWEEVEENPAPLEETLKTKVEELMTTDIKSKGDLEKVVLGLTDVLNKVKGINIYQDKVEAALEQAAATSLVKETVANQSEEEKETSDTVEDREENIDTDHQETAFDQAELETAEEAAEEPEEVAAGAEAEATEEETADTKAMEEAVEAETAVAEAMEEAGETEVVDEEVIIEAQEEAPEAEVAVTEEPEEALEAEAVAEEQEETAKVESTDADLSPMPEYALSYGEEQKRILSYFTRISGVDEEVAHFMNREYDHGENILITGSKGSGRTSLALRLMKAIASSSEQAPRKIAKLSALALNKKPVEAVFAKIGKGALVIENAEDLEGGTCEALYKAMNKYANCIRIIMVGETSQMEELLKQNQNLVQQFSYTFHLKTYKNDELVDFAREYAQTKGYTLDEMATLALYTRLADEKVKKSSVGFGEVKEIVKEAISNNENRKGVKSFFSNMLTRNVDEDGYLVLREKDFEN